jgi:hypothetical protein
MNWMIAERESSQIKALQMKVLLPAAVAICFSLAALLSVSGLAQTAKKEPPWVAKDWTKWSQGDCDKILKDSPWGQSSEYSINVGGQLGPDYHNSKSNFQFRSALPIRQALIREMQIQAKYDKMTAQQRGSFDQQNGQLLSQDYSGAIVLYYSESAWEDQMFLPGRGSVGPPRECALVAPDGSAVMPDKVNILKKTDIDLEYEVDYPRLLNGKPLYSASDKKIGIACGVLLSKQGTSGTESYVVRGKPQEFETSNMMYKGKLEY